MADSDTSHYKGNWDKHETSPVFKVRYLSAAVLGAQHLLVFHDEAALFDTDSTQS